MKQNVNLLTFKRIGDEEFIPRGLKFVLMRPLDELANSDF